MRQEDSVPVSATASSSRIRHLWKRLSNYLPGSKRRHAATAIEYCVIASLISVIAILGAQQVGSVVSSVFSESAGNLEEVVGEQDDENESNEEG
ncbi:MAG: Flp family type IVb pilin [Pirellulaceae bacterium]|nr:Flp family type IVb pilin [Pirellulaceae bacterium]